MKKLMIVAFAAMLGITANAAAVTWSMSGVTASPDAPAAAGWAVYVMDASTFSTFSALDGDKVAAYAAANALYSGATTDGRTGVNANITNGDFAANATVNSYMVIFNNAVTADATYFAYTDASSVTISEGGANAGMNFGTFANATAATGGWQSTDVPEPTSGLLLLLGVAGLALRRKQK